MIESEVCGVMYLGERVEFPPIIDMLTRVSFRKEEEIRIALLIVSYEFLVGSKNENDTNSNSHR
jgi:hypothetical protein